MVEKFNYSLRSQNMTKNKDVTIRDYELLQPELQEVAPKQQDSVVYKFLPDDFCIDDIYQAANIHLPKTIH